MKSGEQDLELVRFAEAIRKAVRTHQSGEEKGEYLKYKWFIEGLSKSLINTVSYGKKNNVYMTTGLVSDLYIAIIMKQDGIRLTVGELNPKGNTNLLPEEVSKGLNRHSVEFSKDKIESNIDKIVNKPVGYDKFRDYIRIQVSKETDGILIDGVLIEGKDGTVEREDVNKIVCLEKDRGELIEENRTEYNFSLVLDFLGTANGRTLNNTSRVIEEIVKLHGKKNKRLQVYGLLEDSKLKYYVYFIKGNSNEFVPKLVKA